MRLRLRLRLDLAYDGAGFHGWAAQPGLRTVQGELEGALDTVLRTRGTVLTVAGRTDAGVHARGQVAHFETDRALVEAACGGLDLRRLLRRLNGVLDADVRLRSVAEAAVGFDARFSALWRRYAYRIADRPEAVDPLARGHVLDWPRELDDRAMNLASARLMGEHDFGAFCKKRPGATTIRTLLELCWHRESTGILVARVRADAFCHHMVRSLTGCLLAVGEGRREEGWPQEVLASTRRDPAVTVLPAHGLTLEEVGYPAAEGLARRAEESRSVRSLTPDA